MGRPPATKGKAKSRSRGGIKEETQTDAGKEQTKASPQRTEFLTETGE